MISFVSVLWRAKEGLLNCSRPRSFLTDHDHQNTGLAFDGVGLYSQCQLVLAVITHLLLSAGDVERNPGPMNRGQGSIMI